jgi:hypothetical protein
MKNTESGLLQDCFRIYIAFDAIEDRVTVRSLRNCNEIRSIPSRRKWRRGMAQVQSQLATLTIQLQDLAKGKEKCEEVWCTTCRIEGHHKNECPTFQ